MRVAKCIGVVVLLMGATCLFVPESAAQTAGSSIEQLEESLTSRASERASAKGAERSSAESKSKDRDKTPTEPVTPDDPAPAPDPELPPPTEVPSSDKWPIDERAPAYGAVPDPSNPTFHFQLWDAQKTNWAESEFTRLKSAGFTVIQNGWNGSMFPSTTLLQHVAKHGLLYGLYLDTRHIFRQKATTTEKNSVRYVTNYDGTVNKSEFNTFDSIYQNVVKRELTNGLKPIAGMPALYKIMFNSEHYSPVSYDGLTETRAREAGVLKSGQKLPPYKDGVSRLPSGSSESSFAERVGFARWFDSEGADHAINRVGIATARALMPRVCVTVDPVQDRLTYGQYRQMDVLTDWIRVHNAPRDPLSVAYRVERMKAHIRHEARLGDRSNREIWIGPQLGSKTSNGNYAAPADVLEEAMWTALTFGARGITFWGYDSIRWTSALDQDMWSRIPRVRSHVQNNIPGLIRSKDAPRKFAVLFCKANQVLTSRAGYAVEENYENFFRVLLTAQIPTDVLYDDDVLAGQLSKYKALFLPGVERIRPDLSAAIDKFKAGGGRVITWPVLLPKYRDYFITQGNTKEDLDVNNPGSYAYLPHQYRDWRKQQAVKLRDTVKDLLDVTCNNPDVILNVVLRNGYTYVVVVNDKRTYGPWTTERRYRLTEDKGVATSARITIRTSSGVKTATVSLPAGGIGFARF